MCSALKICVCLITFFISLGMLRPEYALVPGSDITQFIRNFAVNLVAMGEVKSYKAQGWKTALAPLSSLDKTSNVIDTAPKVRLPLIKQIDSISLELDMTLLTEALRLSSNPNPTIQRKAYELLREGRERIKRIKAVTFDLAGVFSSNGLVLALRELEMRLQGIDYVGLNFVFHGAPYFKWAVGEIDEEKFWGMANQVFKEQFHVDIFAQIPLEEFKEIWYGAYEIVPEVRDLVQELKRKGYKVILFTNNTREKFAYFNKRYGITNLFDDVINTADIGYSKLDRRSHEIVLKRAGVEPDELLYIDDVEKYFEHPWKIGILTLLYSSLNQTSLREEAVIQELLDGSITQLLTKSELREINELSVSL